MTQFEKIKAMSLEKMANKFDCITSCNYCFIKKFCNLNGIPIANRQCREVFKLWLESEVNSNERG